MFRGKCQLAVGSKNLKKKNSYCLHRVHLFMFPSVASASGYSLGFELIQNKTNRQTCPLIPRLKTTSAAAHCVSLQQQDSFELNEKMVEYHSFYHVGMFWLKKAEYLRSFRIMRQLLLLHRCVKSDQRWQNNKCTLKSRTQLLSA